MSRQQLPESEQPIESAADGVADALTYRRRRLPSSTFRIELHRPEPADPRLRLPALADAVASYEQRNDRMAVGLKCGMYRLEKNLIPEPELRHAYEVVRQEAALARKQREAEKRR